ncbi:Sugar phosphate permease [Pilibacter termitis]|uniref:Sugar phosphate permease n=1 Tax=Pilibacter termitis TaxID=263852 RepID=A0A1T4LC53_9ENTE|nr:MFS transporter [Pilibacter termitis]SJZ52280.1 Sugar phosphate permease [Pilibacter termitis]
MEISEAKTGVPYWQKVIVMLCMGWIAIWIYRSALTPLFPEIQQSIGIHSNAQMGLISSCYFFGYTGMQIPAGILVDKLGRKIVLIPGFLIFAAAAFLIAKSGTLMTIYIGSFIAGLGCGSYYGSAYSLSSECIPSERRGLSTAIINSGSAVGMGIGLIGSSLLVKSVGLPWQMMMYICSITILVMVLVFARGIKSSVKSEKVEEQAVEKKKEKIKISSLFNIHMIASYLLYFGTCYSYYMIVTWLPSFLQEERGFKGLAIGFSSALVAFAAIPGALFFSRLSDKFKEKKISFILFLELAAAGMLFLVVKSPNATLLLIGLILYGLLGKLAVEPIIISFIGDSASKENYGTTFGIFNFFGMSSSVLAPAITGMISDSTGSKIMGFYIAAAILVVTAIFFLIVNKKR